jgi:hypothetical protein
MYIHSIMYSLNTKHIHTSLFDCNLKSYSSVQLTVTGVDTHERKCDYIYNVVIVHS